MASNKECLVMILDVRQNAATELKRNAVQCVANILKEKICTAKKDYVFFILLGTQRTHNEANLSICSDSYCNIVQYTQPVVPSWNVLVDFMKFVTEPSCSNGDWLDALVVAQEALKNVEDICKVQRQRILLFHDFDGQDVRYNEFDVITNSLLKMEIQLIAVSNNIQYIDNAATGEPQAVFRASHTKTDYQLENEKYALRLVSACNAKLYTFQEAYRNVIQVINRRPSTWNQNLRIGSKICIKISATLANKDMSTIKLKRFWGHPEEEVNRETKMYLHDEEIQPLDVDLIDAYLLGATPVPFDEPLSVSKEPLEPGLKFLGFVKRDSIPTEYYCGDAQHLVVHQKGMQASAKMMDALVKALLKMQMSILCWKVYSVKLNNPKIVLLLPNRFKDDVPASLSMVEIAYHAQHHFWDFPRLRTQKNECTVDQLDAIDNLIDSMDLTMPQLNENKEQTRDTLQKDLLPFDKLPHVYEQCLLDMLERKVLCVAGVDDPYLQDLVAEKDYKEVFWRVPEAIEQQAKQAANKVKALFPLEKNVSVSKPKVKSEPMDATNNNMPAAEPKTKVAYKKLEHVGFITPADDFEMLLKHEVLTLQDHTLRDTKFNFYAAQMRSVIWKLLFEAPPLEADKVAEAIKVFRKCCYDFNAFGDFNNWIRKLKNKVQKEKLFDFWSKYIVKQELGLCFVGLPSLEEKLEESQFYKIDDGNNETCELAKMNDSAINDLLASI